MYGSLVRDISEKFSAALEEIQVEYNFDYGDEFEVAICETFRRVLPQGLGICRGFAVNEAGETAGDDIFIYDRMRFPTIRSLGQDDYSKKERIPIEAVLAYIEAKHTLQLNGDGDSSLLHAMKQAAAVKMLCNQREQVSPAQITRNTTVEQFPLKAPEGYPGVRNPMFTVIFARQVRLNKNETVKTDSQMIHDCLLKSPPAVLPRPDLVVAGPNNVILPAIQRHGNTAITSPFFIEGEGLTVVKEVENVGFGIAVISLLWALDYIELGSVKWNYVLADSLKLRIVKRDQTN